ncbi:MAG: hypothetical protein ACYC3S_04350 [Chloroflexota bacterium]
MEKDKAIRGVIDYFKSDQWRRLMAALVQDPDPTGTHIHVFTETCVDPLALRKVTEAYLAGRGYPITRRIDVMSPRPQMGSLHGVEPKGLAHFDWNWFYNENVALAGSPGGEHGESGCNLCVWNRSYIREYNSDFKFRRSIGPAEEEALRSYFRSDVWHKGLEASIDPWTNHCHINCYTSVHPDIIQKFAEESLKEKGWEIFYTCPNVYLVDGKYTGKLVFMGKSPEAVYDLGWMFDPEVVIAPAGVSWVFKDQVNYDLWTQDLLDKVLDRPYLKLADADVDRIIANIGAATV